MAKMFGVMEKAVASAAIGRSPEVSIRSAVDGLASGKGNLDARAAGGRLLLENLSSKDKRKVWFGMMPDVDKCVLELADPLEVQNRVGFIFDVVARLAGAVRTAAAGAAEAIVRLRDRQMGAMLAMLVRLGGAGVLDAALNAPRAVGLAASVLEAKKEGGLELWLGFLQSARIRFGLSLNRVKALSQLGLGVMAFYGHNQDTDTATQPFAISRRVRAMGEDGAIEVLQTVSPRPGPGKREIFGACYKFLELFERLLSTPSIRAVLVIPDGVVHVVLLTDGRLIAKGWASVVTGIKFVTMAQGCNNVKYFYEISNYHGKEGLEQWEVHLKVGLPLPLPINYAYPQSIPHRHTFL